MVDYNSTFTGAQVDAAVEKDVDRGTRVRTIDMSTPATNYDLTIPEGIDMFSLAFHHLSVDTASQFAQLRLGVGGVLKTTGYTAYYGFHSGSTPVVNLSTDAILLIGFDTGRTGYGKIDFQRITGNEWAYAGVISGAVNAEINANLVGNFTMSGEIDTISLYATSGNIDGGGKASVYLHM